MVITRFILLRRGNFKLSQRCSPKAPLNYETMNYTSFMLLVSIQFFALSRLVMPGKAGHCAKTWNWLHKNENRLLKGNAAVFDLHWNSSRLLPTERQLNHTFQFSLFYYVAIKINICWRMRSMKFLTAQFSQVSCYFLPLRSRYSLQQPIWNTHSLYSSLDVT